jgi:hypothetical protein
MPMIYSDPSREADDYALPNIEVFYLFSGDYPIYEDEYENAEYLPEGWYWQACFPGCLPDGDPMGPFDTEAEAIADATQDTLE